MTKLRFISIMYSFWLRWVCFTLFFNGVVTTFSFRWWERRSDHGSDLCWHQLFCATCWNGYLSIPSLLGRRMHNRKCRAVAFFIPNLRSPNARELSTEDDFEDEQFYFYEQFGVDTAENSNLQFWPSYLTPIPDPRSPIPDPRSVGRSRSVGGTRSVGRSLSRRGRRRNWTIATVP